MAESGPRATIGLVARGFAMGSADVVPGVSGGTVALVTGIYERLVSTISDGSRVLESFVRGKYRRGLRQLGALDWWFLVPLVAGAVAAVLTLAGVLERSLADHPVRMAALFLGLIAGTIAIAWRMIVRPRPLHGGLVLGVGALFFALFGLQSSTIGDPSLVGFFGSGLLSIVAFILPGISGSFILLSIGMYQAVIGAVADRDLVVIVVFGLGAIIGLAVFSRVLHRLLDRHHDIVVSVLVGLMVGSLRILWPWPNGLGDEDGRGATVLGAPHEDVLVPVVLIVAGAAVVLVIAELARRSVTHQAVERRAAGGAEG
jgi:putative membrane protein